MKLTDEEILTAAKATISLADGGYVVDIGAEHVISFAKIIAHRALEAAAEVINSSEGDMDFASFRIRAMAKEIGG